MAKWRVKHLRCFSLSLPPGDSLRKLGLREVMTEARTKRLNVQYFAILREQAGRSEEWVETTAKAPRELFGELRARHGFTVDPGSLKVVINDEFHAWTDALADGDTVVFIPPVAGG